MITILNTSILTNYGTFRYKKISLDDAKKLVKEGFQSAIGHDATANIISTLLNINCPVNRILYRQEIVESALVFKLKGRPKEGQILTEDELKKIGYEWGILIRIK
jgi:hypothetical protein